eukprot:TRINITY_DN8977_c0_g1_i1.p1 TRINITY_DN8977_c0_g1~~TRINITY_DN8977_c0_g1_i1.p1  ORF type:complete len:688 (+),score=273.87 TRINITY_DN8977_c0_g1_i1:54-2117(+)
MEYFVVMLPYNDRNGDGNSEYKAAINKLGCRIAKTSKFQLPNFKVGTLDSLMECSDELAKLDTASENSVSKLLTTGEQLYLEGKSKDQIKKVRSELLTVSVLERDQHGMQPTEKSKSIQSYLESWQWDDFKYTDVSEVSIKKMCEDLNRPILTAEELIKKRVAEYSDIKGKAAAAAKKVDGNLTVKDITQEVSAWNSNRKTPLPEELLRRRAAHCEGTQLVMLFVAVSKKDEELWKEYWQWGITDDQKHAMNSIKEGGTDHVSDGVSISRMVFKCGGKDIDMSHATASNEGGSQSGYGCMSDTGLPENVLDGTTDTAWFDANKKPLVIDFGVPTKVEQYCFSTGTEAPQRDPVQWVLSGYTPPPADAQIPTLTINIANYGPLEIVKGQSEQKNLAPIHSKLTPAANKRIYLKEEESGYKVSAVFDELENNGNYTFVIEEKGNTDYGTKEEKIDLGKWEEVHAMDRNDFHTPKERKQFTDVLNIKSPKEYTKYRFESKVTRGNPERGPIPCGNGAVPGTSEIVASQGEYNLMSVMVFSQLEHHFRALCRDHKFTVREYEPATEAGSRARTPQADYQALEEKRCEKKESLLRDIKTHFSEAYTAWIHIKAVRAFVEAILRYGLPAKYISMLFHCDSKNSKAHDEMRAKLAQHYSHLNPSGFDLAEDANESSALQERYPYVSLRITNFEH